MARHKGLCYMFCHFMACPQRGRSVVLGRYYFGCSGGLSSAAEMGIWDVPKSTMHAVSDIGALVEWLQEHIAFGQDSTENLAVLHNQNHMVHEFGLSAWVTQSKRQVISRSVTSCAGMTAYMVVVAQTKVGFLTGGRGEKFRKLPEEERRTQEEEAYARATVALTRARKMRVIFCPLDMKGLIGAATVMGSLMYGAGHCRNGMVNMHLRNSSLMTA